MKTLKIIGKLLSIIISFLISIVCLLMITYITINNVIKVKNLKQTIKTENLLKIKYEEKTIKENIIETFEEIGIPKEEIITIIESTEFNQLFDDYLNKIMEYYLENKTYPSFNEEKLNKLVNKITNQKTIIEEKIIKESIKKIKTEIENELPKKEEIMEEPEIKEIINTYKSISIFYFIGTIIILMFLIFIFTWSLYMPFLYAGISFIIPAITIIITYLFKNIIINIINQEEFVNIILNQILNQLLITSIIVLLIGIIFIIFYKITTKKEI